jgi:hypothetical protein
VQNDESMNQSMNESPKSLEGGFGKNESLTKVKGLVTLQISVDKS